MNDLDNNKQWLWGIFSSIRNWVSSLPLWAKLIILALVLLYGVSPVDLIPDVFPPFTYADDTVVLLLGLWLVSGTSKSKELEEFDEYPENE